MLLLAWLGLAVVFFLLLSFPLFFVPFFVLIFLFSILFILLSTILNNAAVMAAVSELFPLLPIRVMTMIVIFDNNSDVVVMTMLIMTLASFLYYGIHTNDHVRPISL